MNDEDAIELPEDDFRRVRRYLAPSSFALSDYEDGDDYPPPSDLVLRESWDGTVDLPTDVALWTSSHRGSTVDRLYSLHSDWRSSWPEIGDGPKMFQWQKMKLAMALRAKNAHYQMAHVQRRHWNEVAKTNRLQRF